MKKAAKIFLIAGLYCFFSCGVSTALKEGRPENWSQKVECADFYNFHKVDNDLFRSEQPTKAGMKGLETMGVKTVLNLRNIRDDKSEAKGVNMKLIHHRINTWTITYKEVVEAVKSIKNAPKPVLVHCKHGSDRTGCVVAVYRMAFMGWSKEDAIKEFKQGGYGYHEKAFPNIIRLLNKIDINQLKSSL